ncbi:MAG TPA: M56 family metallopeptidase, partial [Planctomycetaceae bacterium]|nr:M56 family metallopeptidase [Planctomycetaceae bacterium]
MNWLSTLIDSPVIERLGWTLVHSLWQGLAVAIVLALALPALRRRGARAAYGVCCGALLLTVSLPAATFCVLPESRKSEAATSASSRGPKETTAAERPATVRSLPIVVLREDESVVSRVNSSGAPANVGAPSRASRHDSSIEGRVVVQRLASVASPPDAPTVPARAPVASAPASLSWKDWAAGQARQLRERLSAWLPWAVLAWSVGVVALSLWNLGGLFAVRRLKLTGTTPAPSAVQQAAVRIAQKLGLTRRVRLVQSALVDSPVVIGALKPVILLPASLITEIPADQLESLLAHELAHVLRHDYLVNLVQSAIETLLFYHPAVWWISAQVRTERENCCDDLAIAVASDRAVYVRALATVAGARTSQMAPAATGGRLIPRLRRILGVVDPAARYSSRWLTGVIILTLGAASIVAIAIQSPSATAQVSESRARESKPQLPAAVSKTAPSRNSGYLAVRVFDDVGKPLPEAVINVEVTTEGSPRSVRDYRSDSQGRATVDVPKPLQSLQLFVTKPGYLKNHKAFWPKSAGEQPAVPESFEFHLPRPVTIGGVVKDEQAKPIKGARVQHVDQKTFARSESLTDASGH